MTTVGGPDAKLEAQQVRDFVRTSLAPVDLDGRSLCLVIPDATRRCPLPLLIDAILAAVADRVSSCTAVVALGTHAPMDAEVARIAADPLFPLVTDRRELRSEAWLPFVGYTRDSTFKSNSVSAAERVAARLQQAIEAATK